MRNAELSQTHRGSNVRRTDVAYVFDATLCGPDGRLLLDETHHAAVVMGVVLCCGLVVAVAVAVATAVVVARRVGAQVQMGWTFLADGHSSQKSEELKQ